MGEDSKGEMLPERFAGGIAMADSKAMDGPGFDFQSAYSRRNSGSGFPARQLTREDMLMLARSETEASLKRLAAIRDDNTAAPMVQVAAANSLLDRAWGKPAAMVAVMDVKPPPEYDLSKLTSEELIQLEYLLGKTGSPLDNACAMLDVTPKRG